MKQQTNNNQKVSNKNKCCNDKKQQLKTKEDIQAVYHIEQNSLSTVVFHKSWHIENNIMGDLHLEASSHSVQESYNILEKLLQLSNRHDILTESKSRVNTKGVKN